MQDWIVEFAASAVEDLTLIEAHLKDAYITFGDRPVEAARRAEARVDSIIAEAERLTTAPFRGAPHDHLIPGLRHLELDRAIYWYLPDPALCRLQILAIFFGGQDHQRHMLVRLLRESTHLAT
ncbi:type II toxin-antitoxin system RelE/ParE family toxin [Paracoccus laeviglucosivorans]|uniref:Plasmid stabilization system protein ParE n=1 Tax=Paracoccus laeviglucosivorans TaxID=1197861 RepID=A0A521FRJ0_9RHOB|nr:type II toxin-antitoxin system RelE/ParE family toxin [Paracoccus laeviglucosivorans]SMO98847.1 hypothetical protein SAMN06265221_13715 [Paracoccus laeviglucosivorans]